ncbi:MAG TPA: outer membrane protein assembly factor BamD [Allosphingosinicella sp.]|jgi:outer membrane protein assembly factor BamD|nr:outer membrane protein assembly factor BamD [Allosphingosinicella sp.]
MHKNFRIVAALAALASIAPLSACAGGAGQTRADTRYVARDVNTLYNAARNRLDRGLYLQAAGLFDEVERQHPYSVWARRAQLMSAFSYYAANDHTKSVDSARRFLSIHPGNRDAPYALYLISLNYYEQIRDVTRDQATTRQAMDALNEVIRRYPQSRYAADARLKMDLVRDHLAGHEMEVGRFYQDRRQWLASVIRFRNVIDEYQQTSHVPEALMRLTESYLALGMPEEARRSAAVLGTNFANTDWYQRAYNLMQGFQPRPERAARVAAARTRQEARDQRRIQRGAQTPATEVPAASTPASETEAQTPSQTPAETPGETTTDTPGATPTPQSL